MGATEKVRSSWGIGITGVSVGEAGILSGPVNFWPMWSSGLRGHRRYRQGESPGGGARWLDPGHPGQGAMCYLEVCGALPLRHCRPSQEATS